MSGAENAVEEALGWGSGWVLSLGLMGLLFYFLRNPSKVAQWASMITGALEKISSRSARHSSAVSIQGKVAAFVKSTNMGALMPYGLRIKWIVGTGDESYVDKADVVVIMAYRRNSDRNFITAVRNYTSKALLPTIRHDLPRSMIGAAEIVIQERMIRSEHPSALGIFVDEVVPSIVRGDAEMRQWLESLGRLDRLGFLANVLLNEIALHDGPLLDLDDAARANEVSGLAKFLERFWGRIQGEDIPLAYRGSVLKVQIILVAKLETQAMIGAAAYLGRAERALSKGIRSVYVTGVAKDQGFVEQVIRAIRDRMPERFEWVRKFKFRQQHVAYDAVMAFFRR